MVRKRHHTLLQKNITAPKHKVELKSCKLANGKLEALVSASNTVGYGTATEQKFHVRS